MYVCMYLCIMYACMYMYVCGCMYVRIYSALIAECYRNRIKN